MDATTPEEKTSQCNHTSTNKGDLKKIHKKITIIISYDRKKVKTTGRNPPFKRKAYKIDSKTY